MTLDALEALHRQDPNLTDRSKAFWVQFRLALACLRQVLGNTDVTSWTRADIAKYRAWQLQQPQAATTLHQRVRLVDQILHWAVKRGHLLRHPDPPESDEKPEGGHYFVPTLEQVQQLLTPTDASWLGQRDHTMWETVYGTGLRRAEMLRLNVEDFVPSEPSLWVRQSKGRKDRKQPLGPHLAKCLEHYLARVRPKLRPLAEETAMWIDIQGGARLSGQSMWIRLRKATKPLGFPQCCLHSLRHAFATHLLEGGAQMHEIRRLLGHSRLETTEIYTKIFPQELLREYRRTHPRAQRRCRTSAPS